MSEQTSLGNAVRGNSSAVTGNLTSSPESICDRIERSLDLIADATEAVDATIDLPDVSLIVPVYNEISTLPVVLERIDEVMPPTSEIIIVDDGSHDGTAQWLLSQPTQRRHKIVCRRRNHGKGSAVRLAIRHSRGRVVAIQDADLEYDPANLLAAIQPILDGTADVIYGSRYLNGCDDPSLVHQFGNWLLTQLSNRLTGLNLTDMETCHKAFRGDLIRSISLRECRFGFEPEITAKIAALGLQIKEIPTAYDCRGYDEGKKIGWRDGLAALACMWKYHRS